MKRVVDSLKQCYRMLRDQEYQKYQELLDCVPSYFTTSRTEVINFLLDSIANSESRYLEIGTRDPRHNFNKIKAKNKISVDPCFEFNEPSIDYKMTSDDFFSCLNNKLLSVPSEFDIIFIDGLHKADQVQRDICNSLQYLSSTGFILVHDCNPPSEWHARSDFKFKFTPARNRWNGTVWKAMCKVRQNTALSSCVVDSDWGIGVISKQTIFSPPAKKIDEFFEFDYFEENKKELLGLVGWSDFQQLIRDRH